MNLLYVVNNKCRDYETRLRIDLIRKMIVGKNPSQNIIINYFEKINNVNTN